MTRISLKYRKGIKVREIIDIVDIEYNVNNF